MIVVSKTHLIAVPLAALTVLLTGCPEPQMKCRTAQGPYGVRYEGDTSCVGRIGDVIGMRTYNPDEEEKTPDFNHVAMALQVYSMGYEFNLVSAYDPTLLGTTNDDLRIMGDFEDSDPDEDGMCQVGTLGTTRLQHGELVVVDDPKTKDVDESADSRPAMDVEYEWSNLEVLATPAAQGLQFIVDVEFQDNLASCSSSFQAIGVYPYPYGPCATDEDCGPATGILGDFPVRCEPTIDVPGYGTGVCVLDGVPPAYK